MTDLAEFISEGDAQAALATIIKGYTDYQTCLQQEITKRTAIESQERLELLKIRSKTKLLLHYLDRTFDERRDNFSRLFSNLDQATERGQVDMAAATLASIVDLAKTSPFKVLTADDAQRFLSDPDAEMEMDF